MSKHKRQFREFGFGSTVATEKGTRLLNRDGTFTVRRTGLGWRAFLSLYHSLLAMRWHWFLLLLLVLFLGLNSIFATLYVACGPGAIEGPPDTREHGAYLQAFAMSVQTLSTVGYGHLRPVGLAANMVMTLEAFVGLLVYALFTGLIFARFSRPFADLAVSESAVVAPYGEGRGIMVRIANRRRNEIIDLHARVIASYLETERGQTARRYIELPLECNHVSFFPLSWTLVHALDDASPLHRWTHEHAVDRDLELLVMLTGMDEDESKTVHARTSFKAEEIEWGTQFGDIFERGPAGNPVAVDVSRVGDTEKL
ncbi:MAG: ion channel [Planctomycetota bacterium]